jgi:hypothetical protein
MSWFQWIQFILALMPQIFQIIVAIEEAIGAGNGQAKKVAALNSITTAAVLAGANEKQVSSLTNTLSGVIDAQVGIMNTAGTLKKSK